MPEGVLVSASRRSSGLPPRMSHRAASRSMFTRLGALVTSRYTCWRLTWMSRFRAGAPAKKGSCHLQALGCNPHAGGRRGRPLRR